MNQIYLTAVLTAFFVALVATPLSIFLARKFSALDAPSERKVHQHPIPRWGGIGIMSGFFAALTVLWIWFPKFKKLLAYSHGVKRKGVTLFTLSLGEQLSGILIGVLILCTLGLFDDRKPVRPVVKLLLQIIAAYVAMTYGVKIYGLSIPGLEAYSHFPLWIMQLITILWLVGLTNSINLIDGLDGLAGGVVTIVCGAFLAIVLVQNQSLMPWHNEQMKLAGVIAACLLGASVGFLIYNFHPAHVFMGDGGSLSLGFLVGCMTVIGTFKTTILAVLLVPFFLIAIPMFDMTMVVGRRLLKKQNPFLPDRSHLHHHLLDSGWTQREVVFMVYAITLVLALISITAVGMR